MSRRNAEKELRAWLTSPYAKGIQLADEEIDKLMDELIARFAATPPKAVDTIVRRMFPNHFTGEKNMQTSRVVPRLESRAAQPQSIDEIKAVVDKYAATGHWQSCASEFALPWGANGKVRSEINFGLVVNAIKDFLATGKKLRVDSVAEIVFALTNEVPLRLERVQKTVEVEPAPPPPPPSADELARQAHNKIVRIDRAMNRRDRDGDSDSPLKGGKEKAQPLLKPTTNTNVAEQIASEKAAEDNATVREAQRLISVFQGASHSRTYSGRAHLESVLTAALDEGVGAKEALLRVQQAADKLQDSGSIR